MYRFRNWHAVPTHREASKTQNVEPDLIGTLEKRNPRRLSQMFEIISQPLPLEATG